MTALRPPTKPERDPETGNWVSGYNPGSLGTEPMDPAPPEATAEHPVVVQSGWTGGFLNEEAHQWVRPVDTLSDEECMLPFAVGLDLNTAFLAATARLVVGLSAPDHFHAPTFNPKIPGSWLVDLSHIELDARLPSPFTPQRRQRHAATTGGITVETRARFGYTAPIGTTDDGRFRRLTVHLPPEYARHLFNAREAGSSDQEMRGIISEGLKEVYFQDGGGRAMGLSDVEINDINYLDLDY